MGHWFVVVPKHDHLVKPINYLRNPSFETSGTARWTASGTTPSRIEYYAVRGAAYLQISTGTGDNYIESETIPLGINATIYVSAYVKPYIAAPAVDASVRIWDASNSQIRATTTKLAADAEEGTWYRLSASWKNTTGAGVNVKFRIGNFTSSTETFIDIDACQAIAFDGNADADEMGLYSYFDGDSDGAYWVGAEHDSYSHLEPGTREHGAVLDLDDDLGLDISTVSGSGLPVYDNNLIGRAQGDGAYFSTAWARPRALVLRSSVTGSTLANLYTNRRLLVEALRPDRGRQNQSIRMFHRQPDQEPHDPNWRELRVRYDGGLELQKVRGFTDNFTLRLLAPDPNFYRERWDSNILDCADTDTYNQGAAKIDGVWSPIPNNYPAGVSSIWDIYPSKNLGKIIIAGDFDDWNSLTAGDNIIAYDPEDGTVSALGDGLNGQARMVRDGPDGKLYVVGDFTASGATTLNKVASWDGSSWTNLVSTAPTSGNVYALCFDEYGDIIVVGNFIDLNGVTNADGIASYELDQSSWASLGNGWTTGVGRAVQSDLNGHIYVVGNLTSVGGVTVYNIAKYTYGGDGWSMVGNTNATNPGLYNGQAEAMVRDNVGNFYIGGQFDKADDESVDGICRFDGTVFYPVGGGLGSTSGIGKHLWYDEDADDLYVGGAIYGAGGIEWLDWLAVWNGSGWRHVDMDAPGSPSYIVACTQHGNLYIAFDTNGSTTTSDVRTFDNIGTERAYPIIKISATGGTCRRLLSIINETTGAALYFDLEIGNGEQITIDFRPTHRGMVSNYAGRRLRIFPESCFSEFYLIPGDNLVSAYLYREGSPTVTAHIRWRPTYGSAD